eukprot:134621_1
MIGEFVQEIDKYTVDDIVPLLEHDFTTTTMQDKLAGKICIMDICKNYFEYKCWSKCGFPEITLCGNKNDWVKLKNKTVILLKEKIDKRFGNKWSKSLIPLLYKFI